MAEGTTLIVDPSNAEQARAWDGDEGTFWTERADHFDRSIAEHHEPFLAAADIGSADDVLDVGCGTGQTTRDAARAAAAGSALGVDLSSRMIDYARKRAAEEGVGNAAFVQADAQIRPFEPASFDVAISRTAAMFFGDLVAAFRNIGRALRPGGRLTLLTWQPLPENEWLRELSSAFAAGRDLPAPSADAPGPFALSDPERVRSVLGAAGFADVGLEASIHDMWFGTDVDDATTFILGVLGWMLQGLDDDGRARALEVLRDTLSAHESAAGVTFGSAAWTIRARRL